MTLTDNIKFCKYSLSIFGLVFLRIPMLNFIICSFNKLFTFLELLLFISLRINLIHKRWSFASYRVFELWNGLFTL